MWLSEKRDNRVRKKRLPEEASDDESIYPTIQEQDTVFNTFYPKMFSPVGGMIAFV